MITEYNYELRITNYELRITNYGIQLRITNYELRRLVINSFSVFSFWSFQFSIINFQLNGAWNNFMMQ